jgi:hypothetical protein
LRADLNTSVARKSKKASSRSPRSPGWTPIYVDKLKLTVTVSTNRSGLPFNSSGE